MPCPVPDLKKKKKSSTYQAGWRKRYMVDLNTLATKEDWLKKLNGITPEAYSGLRQALQEMRMMRE